MVVDTKLYDLLGVSPDADERTLKKAYMTKARELHPDKNQSDPEATEKFQAMNEAYEILKDSQKRELYDRYGPDGLREGMGGDPGDIFSHLFNPFGGFGGSRGAPRRQRTQDIAHEVKVTLEDLYNGKEINIKLTRSVLCSDCNGSGCKNGKKPTQCRDCGGKGQKVQVVRMGPMITQQVTTCPSCRGTGETVSAADKCTKCKGQKVIDEDKRIAIHVERGMEDGDKIVFKGAADEAPNCDTGDLVVSVREKKHQTFIRRHADLLIKKKISLSDALLGTKILITHLDGRKVVVDTTDMVISPNAVKVIDREGMPNKGNPFNRGKLYIHFEVEFPSANQLNSDLRAALQKAIPIKNEAKDVDPNDEEVTFAAIKNAELKDFENTKRQGNNARREAYGDDDDDQQEGGGVGCQPM